MAKQDKYGVLLEGKETISDAAKKAESGLSGLSKSMFGAVTVANLVSDSLKALGRVILDLVKGGVDLALSFEGIESSFRRLTISSDKFLAQLKIATRGTVAEIDLMKQANQALLLGIDQEALPNMFKGAATIAQATGDDITFALNSITAGIGRQSRMLLDNLGIIVRAEEAQENYAKSLGKTKAELTDTEKRIAFTNAAIDGLNQRVTSLGGEVLPTAQTALNQFNTEWTNLKENIGERVTPVLKEFLDNVLTPLITKLNELMTDPYEEYLKKTKELAEEHWDLVRAQKEEANSLKESSNAIKENTKAKEDNKKATEELTLAEKRHQELGGIYRTGSGEIRYGSQMSPLGGTFGYGSLEEAQQNKIVVESNTS